MRYTQEELKRAAEIMEAYAEDPYEIVEATWIGAGKQIFYRDRMDGTFRVSTGAEALPDNVAWGLKDVQVVRISYESAEHEVDLTRTGSGVVFCICGVQTAHHDHMEDAFEEFEEHLEETRG